MAFARTTAVATAGNIGKGGLANSKTNAYLVEGDTDLVAGRFVAISDGGVKALAKNTDCLAGVVVRSVLKDDWTKGEVVDVMHIGTADGIWVEVAKGETVKRGDKVIVLTADAGEKKAGQIQSKADANGITTDYTVITVADGLAEITRL